MEKSPPFYRRHVHARSSRQNSLLLERTFGIDLASRHFEVALLDGGTCGVHHYNRRLGDAQKRKRRLTEHLRSKAHSSMASNPSYLAGTLWTPQTLSHPGPHYPTPHHPTFCHVTSYDPKGASVA